MANEFEFLRARWPKLAALGADAARLVDFSPVTALSSLRDYCEWAADIALELTGNAMPPETMQMERLSMLKSIGSVPPDVLQKFHNIRSTEDRASSNPLGDPNEARARMADAIDIGRWLIRQDGNRPAYGARPARSHAPATGGDAYATGRRSAVGRDSYARSTTPPEADDSMLPPDEEYTPDGYSNADRPPQRPRFGGGEGGGGGFDFGKYRRYLTMPVIISAVLVIVLLIALIAILNQCGRSGRPTLTGSTTPTETYSILVTPPPVTSTTPAPAVTTPKYLDEFATADITKSHTNWTTYYLGKWAANQHTGNFSVFNGSSGDGAAGVLYEHGLGWFIKKNEFAADEDKRALTFATKGLYDTLIFDMGIDKEWGFSSAPDCGSYQIMVFIDDQQTPVYTSNMVNHSYYKTDISVNVAGAQKVKIRLIEKKGTAGSLNVVLGNARFIPSANPQTTTAASETTTAAGETTVAGQTTTAAGTTTTGQTTTPAGQTTTTAAAN